MTQKQHFNLCFFLPKVYYDLFVHITQANLVTVGISVATIIILSVWNEFIKVKY